MDDVLWVIMWGELKGLEKDSEHNNWKCTISGKDIEEDDLTVIMALDEETETVIGITVF